MSAGWWRTQHNKHHAMPQKLGADVDLDTLPLVAFTEKVMLQVKRMGATQKQWLRIQGYMFPIITTLLVTMGWQLYLHPRFIMRRQLWNEAVTLIVRYLLWTCLVTISFEVDAPTCACWIALIFVRSRCLSVCFSPRSSTLLTTG